MQMMRHVGADDGLYCRRADRKGADSARRRNLATVID